MVEVLACLLDRRLAGSLLMEVISAGAQMVLCRAVLRGRLLASEGGRADQPEAVRFREEARAQDECLLAARLAHVKTLPWATHVVVGGTPAAASREIVAAWGSTDLDLIDPGR